MDIVKAHLLYRLFIHASDPSCFPSCSVAADSKASYASQGADVQRCGSALRRQKHAPFFKIRKFEL
jgi:hypothetical protein